MTSITFGCATNKNEEFENFINKNNIIPEEQVKLNIPEVRPVRMKRIEWKVVTRTNVNEILTEMERRGRNPVIFGISDDDYENLSINMLELLNYIESNDKILDEYRKYYESNNK